MLTASGEPVSVLCSNLLGDVLRVRWTSWRDSRNPIVWKLAVSSDEGIHALRKGSPPRLGNRGLASSFRNIDSASSVDVATGERMSGKGSKADMQQQSS